MATTYRRVRPRSDTALQVEGLLGRYPRLSDDELAKLIDLTPNLSMLDQVLITADNRMAAQLADFLRDHRSSLRTPRGERFALLMLPAILATLSLWWILS